MIRLLLLTLLLVGCSSVPGSQEVVAETVDTVNQSSSVINNDLEPWVLGVIILLAGWAIPSPGEMLRGLVSGISIVRGVFR